MSDEEKEKDRFREVKKYMSIAVSALCVIVVSILFFFAVYRFKTIVEFFGKVLNILQPIIFGLLFAYILNPLMMRLEKSYKKLFKGKKIGKFRPEKISRIVSVSLSMIIGIAVIYILISLVVPELIKSIMALALDLPSKIDILSRKLYEYAGQNENIAQWINGAMTSITQNYSEWINSIRNLELADFTTILQKINDWFGFVAVGVKGVASTVFNILIGLIVAIYVLNSKEKFIGQAKKIMYAFMGTRTTNTVLTVVRKSDKIFGGFIIGKLIDSAIIGVLCFAGMSVLRLPYAVLISTIVGITNIIPFFGPYIGAIPSVILLLLSKPIQGVYFTIFILILQQVDGNIIGPKILGNSTGLSAFWVMFAILVGGGLFGVLGMIFGVPLLSVIFYIFETIVNSKLRKKQLPEKSAQYTDIETIDRSSGTPEISYLVKKGERPVIDENKVPKVNVNINKKKK